MASFKIVTTIVAVDDKGKETQVAATTRQIDAEAAVSALVGTQSTALPGTPPIPATQPTGATVT